MNQKQREALVNFADQVVAVLVEANPGMIVPTTKAFSNLRAAFEEPEPLPTPDATPTAENYGRVVRAAWVEWCRERGETKYHKVCPYDEMPEKIKDVDNRIGIAVANYARRTDPVKDALYQALKDLHTMVLNEAPSLLEDDHHDEECLEALKRYEEEKKR